MMKILLRCVYYNASLKFGASSRQTAFWWRLTQSKIFFESRKLRCVLSLRDETYFWISIFFLCVSWYQNAICWLYAPNFAIHSSIHISAIFSSSPLDEMILNYYHVIDLFNKCFSNWKTQRLGMCFTAAGVKILMIHPILLVKSHWVWPFWSNLFYLYLWTHLVKIWRKNAIYTEALLLCLPQRIT